jgi:hypothetical protein
VDRIGFVLYKLFCIKIQLKSCHINPIPFAFCMTIAGKAGSYQVILKEVQLPITSKPICEKALRKTNLGMNFNLHSSFLCAGGFKDLDTCVVSRLNLLRVVRIPHLLSFVHMPCLDHCRAMVAVVLCVRVAKIRGGMCCRGWCLGVSGVVTRAYLECM